jgi:hypothetical protein
MALLLVFFQASLFRSHEEAAKAEKEAKQQQDSATRTVAAKNARAAEYVRDKSQILAEVEALLSSNQPKEALAAANKYFAVNKDPDLARLQSRAKLGAMKLELENEAVVPLVRREEIYKTLIREMPGGLSQYQGKLSEVTAALAAERQATARAVESAALEAARAVESAALEAGIKKQFSGYDGSHRKVEAELKCRMHNPKSCEHVDTDYTVGADTIKSDCKYFPP